MGNAVATNTANQVVNASDSITNSELTNCYILANNNQQVNIINNQNGCSPQTGSKNKNACKYALDNVTINQQTAITADQSCTASSTFSNSVSSQISLAASQIAQAVNQNLNLNPASTEANNLANEIANVMNSVVNEIQSSCYGQAITNQTVNISGNTGLIAKNLIVSQTAFAQEISNCVFNYVANSGITSTLQEMVSQSAKATVQDSLGLILVAIAVIAVVFFLLTVEIGGYIVLILIIGAFIGALYLLIAYLADLPPFRTNAPPVVAPGTLASNINIAAGTSSNTGRSVSFAPQAGRTGSYQVMVTFPPLKTAGDVAITLQCPSTCAGTQQIYPLAIGDVAAVSPTFTLNSGDIVTITVSSETGINGATIVIGEAPNPPNGLPLPGTLSNFSLSANIPAFFNVTATPSSAHTLTATASNPGTGTLNLFIPDISSPVTVPIPLASSISLPFILPANTFNPGGNSWPLVLWSTTNVTLSNIKIS